MGCHGGGHGGIGGVAVNPIISPNDPAFWLTHGQLDRVYWIWQMLDLKKRSVSVSFCYQSSRSAQGLTGIDAQDVHGTGTFLNIPPSPNVTVEDTIDVLPHAGPVKIKHLMNSVGGKPLCYVYLP
jgi:tyrosinase